MNSDVRVLQSKRRSSMDLAAQHAECELNYARLRRILPDIAQCDRRLVGLPAISIHQHERRLQFCVTERSRYTTSLEIAEFGQRLDWGLSAEFCVRLYHDARMAEVIAFQRQRNCAVRSAYPNSRMHLPDEKKQWNILLSEWLKHCLAHGHTLDITLFHLAESTSAATGEKPA
jgi:uncharacterized protein YqiB (DUF1249 family)